MHLATLSGDAQLTPQESAAATDFFHSLSHFLPCDVCREHYRDHVRAAPPPTETREALARWAVELHNKVNVSLGKEQMTYAEAVAHWTDADAGDDCGCSASEQRRRALSAGALGVLLGVAAALVFFFVWRGCSKCGSRG